MSRQLILLLLLIGLLAAALVYAFVRFPRQQVAPLPAGVQRPVVAPAQPVGSLALRSDLLTLPLQSAKVIRNIFEPFDAPKQAAAVLKKAAAPPPPPLPPTAGEQARQQIRQLKVLGGYRQPDRQALFVSSGGQIRLVRVGDSLVNGYVVASISDDRMVVRSVGGDEIVVGVR